MTSRAFRILPILFLLKAPVFGEEAQWYISNAAGMTLEAAFSRAALREKYALSVEKAAYRLLPEDLRPFYRPLYQIELRTLHENGEPSRRQWIFRDEAGRTRVTAAFDIIKEDDEAEKPEEPEKAVFPEGFIEIYDERELITGEYRLYDDGSSWIAAYSYAGTQLVKVEAREIRPPAAEAVEETEETEEAKEAEKPQEVEDRERALYTDTYRYSRSGSLRAVERVFHQVQETDPKRLVFPHLILKAAKDTNFVGPGSAYSSEFIEDILLNPSSKIVYTTDSRGRVLAETRQDEEGAVLGELRNTWSGDRLAEVRWKADGDDRLTEYEYDNAGNRIMERNYNKGILERVVRREGDREVEELYMNDQVVLRAIWEGGRKIREERVRPSSGGERR